MSELFTEKYFLKKMGFNYEILNGIMDLIRVYDKNNNIIFENKSMKKFLKENKISTSLSEENLKVNLKIHFTKETNQREENINNKDFLIKSSPIIDSVGNVSGIVEIYRNVTKYKRLDMQLRAQNLELVNEIKQAEKIQKSLLPKNKEYNGIKVDYIYNPSNILSGDMFGFIEIDENNLGFYIADAVGHGFSSSMITTFIKLGVKVISKDILLNPSKTLKELNERFINLNLNIEVYYTCFYGILNTKNMKITYSNAGHFPNPVVINENIVHDLEIRGFPISKFFGNYIYENETMDIQKNSKILLMTDGIVGLTNDDGEILQFKEIYDVIAKNNKNELKKVQKLIDKFKSNKKTDDITMVLLKV